MALEMALTTKRGLTPDNPSSGDSLDRFTRINSQFLRHVQSFPFGFRQAGQYGEDGRQLQDVGIEMDMAEGGGPGDELLIYARLVVIGKRVRHLDDDHAVEQCLVLLLL
jgi:hypothetical protein